MGALWLVLATSAFAAVDPDLACFSAGFQCFEDALEPDPYLPIVLGYAPWDTHKLTNSVAKIVLQERFGITVSFNNTDDFHDPPCDFERLATGTEHANLEVWPTMQQALIDHHTLSTGEIENGGFLGAAGYEGLFVLNPAALSPDFTAGLPIALEKMLDPAVVSKLRSVFENVPENYPSHAAFENVILKFFEDKYVAQPNTFKSLEAKIAIALRQNEPLFFAGAYPSALFVDETVSISPVALPRFDPTLWKTFSCGLPTAPEGHLKLFSHLLSDYDPIAYGVLRALVLRTSDHLFMLGALRANKSLTMCEAACSWLKEIDPPFAHSEYVDQDPHDDEPAVDRPSRHPLRFAIFTGFMAVAIGLAIRNRELVWRVVLLLWQFLQWSALMIWYAYRSIFKSPKPEREPAPLPPPSSEPAPPSVVVRPAVAAVKPPAPGAESAERLAWPAAVKALAAEPAPRAVPAPAPARPAAPAPVPAPAPALKPGEAKFTWPTSAKAAGSASGAGPAVPPPGEPKLTWPEHAKRQ